MFIKNKATIFEDPTREPLDPMDEYVRWCPYFKLEPLKFLHKEMWECNEQKKTAAFEF